MKKESKISNWIKRQKIINTTLRNDKSNIKSRYKDIFRIRTLEFILMCVLFILSFSLFHYSYWSIPDGGYKTPILMMITVIINISMLGIALLGMKKNGHKHPYYIIAMLVLFALGDVLSCISSFAGGLPYFLAQIVWCILLYKQTYVNRYQYLVFILLYILAIPVIIYCGQGPLLSIGIALYILPLFAACSMSLNSPFFLLAGIVFAASDLAAFLRASFPEHDSWWVYLISSSLYFIAVLLICCSTYVTKPKTSVTLPEMFNIVKILQKHNVRFWVAGRWTANMALGYLFCLFENTTIICDSRDVDAYKEAMIELGYLTKEDELMLPGKLYCEKFGYLITSIAIFDEDRIRLKAIDKPVIEIDEEFFGEKQFGKQTVPCVTLGL